MEEDEKDKAKRWDWNTGLLKSTETFSGWFEKLFQVVMFPALDKEEKLFDKVPSLIWSQFWFTRLLRANLEAVTALQWIDKCVCVCVWWSPSFTSVLVLRPLIQSFQEQVGKEEARPVQRAHQGAGHHAAGQHSQDGQIHHSPEKHRLPAQAQRSLFTQCCIKSFTF